MGSEQPLMTAEEIFAQLGLGADNAGCWDGSAWRGAGAPLTTTCPATGKLLASVRQADEADYEACMAATVSARRAWADTPMPQRGEIVRQIGDALRAKKAALGALIALEMGKIRSEGEGEVQEFIDVCDMACGMSRSIGGLVIPSERKGHTILETWSPLGTVAIISAFNFPCAVMGWNLAVSLVCGNTHIWKGASTTSLVTVATARIVASVLASTSVPPGVFTFVVGPGRTIGDRLINDPRPALVSFTGSSAVGQRVSEVVHRRFGRTILELGGNNAMVVMPDANLDLALRAAVFGAVGTAGQRCTSLRRLLIHTDIFDSFVARVVAAYASIKPGDPLAPGTLLGPLHTESALKEFTDGLAEIQKQGGKVLHGGRVLRGTDALPEALRGGFYVEPTIVETSHDMPIVKEELFVPILHVIRVASFDEAVALNNAVPQGLSSSLFTNDMRSIFQWISAGGSTCGIVNVNAGTSGAEVGGAFGGEGDTGGGRECGSDSWKQYMRRATCSINYSSSLPLAQGVKFNV